MNWYKLAEAALNITPDQFQAMSFNEKLALARNRSISPQTQLLFFTVKYKGNLNVLYQLANNTIISLQTQLLFFTEEYSDKNEVLKILFQNPSFLKDFTLQELREFAKTKEARLHVYRKRFKTIRAMVLL